MISTKSIPNLSSPKTLKDFLVEVSPEAKKRQGQALKDIQYQHKQDILKMSKRVKSGLTAHEYNDYKLNNLDMTKFPDTAQKIINGYTFDNEANTSLILYGSVGTAKTHIACGLLIKESERVDFKKYKVDRFYKYDFRKLMEEYKDIFYSKNSTKDCKDKFIYNINNTPFLVIDELATHELSLTEINFLETLISKRSSERLKTIITTNADVPKLKENKDLNRLLDRLAQDFFPVMLDQSSYRRFIGAKNKSYIDQLTKTS